MRHINFFLILIMVSCCASATSNFIFSNEPGKYGVGLHVVEQYDYSRAYKGKIDLLTGQPETGNRARPIETLVWYPAQKGGHPITYQTYLRTAASEEEFGLADKKIDRNTQELLKSLAPGMRPEQMHQEEIRPMWAVRDAKPDTGKFPVVIYAPSFGAIAAENADLCEYLASNGYIVIANPSMGKYGRSMTKDLEGIEAQVADIEFLIAYAHSLPQADLTYLAVVGYSWGGISNVFAAAKDSRISALVDLDGSVRYFPKLVTDAKYVTPERVDIPFLFLASQPMPLENIVKFQVDVSASFINKMTYSDVYVASFMSMDHGNFGSGFLRYESDDDFKNYTRAEASLGYSWMARYVVNFLNAYLKGDATGLAFLKNTPEKNGAPNHMISMMANPAGGSPASVEGLAKEGSKQGFEHLGEVYDTMHKANPEFKPTEENLNDWAAKFLANDKAKQATEILKLATVLYPESSDSNDALADAYEHANDRELAIKTYQKSLQIAPEDDNAKQHLKLLGVNVDSKTAS